MSDACARLIRSVAVLLLLVSSGCATSKREAAQNINWTDQIIRQSSALLAADPDLGRYPIVVDGFHNHMVVKGQVATEAERQRAWRIVWAIPGVESVENIIDVIGSERK
jgi:osmotically-inducible protein OsmY